MGGTYDGGSKMLEQAFLGIHGTDTPLVSHK